MPNFNVLPPEQVRAEARYGVAKRWRRHYQAKLDEARRKEDLARAELERVREAVITDAA